MTDKNKPIHVADLDRTFADKVAEKLGSDDLRRCFACGTCTCGCPIREVDERYNPRRILRMVLLGMKDEVLKSDFVWLCGNCHTCRERCPQGVKMSEVMRALKNMAVEEGYAHPAFRMQENALKQFGRLYEIEDFDNKRRTRSGLPELETDPKELKTVIGKAEDE